MNKAANSLSIVDCMMERYDSFKKTAPHVLDVKAVFISTNYTSCFSVAVSFSSEETRSISAPSAFNFLWKST